MNEERKLFRYVSNQRDECFSFETRGRKEGQYSEDSDWAKDWTVQGSYLSRIERFFSSTKFSGWLWGVPSFLFNG